MLLKNRFIILIIFVVVFIAANYFYTKSLLPSAETKDLWFYSGLFMTLFSILFIETYYSSPKNVIANSIPLLLVLISIKTSFHNLAFWWLATSVIVFLLLISILAMVIVDNDKSQEYLGNRISERLKNIAVFLGQGKVLYSAAFFGFLLTYYSINDFYTLVLFVMWFFIVSINPKSLTNTFRLVKNKYPDNAIGGIFSVQSKRMFFVKIFDDIDNIHKFDVINFNYSMRKDASISQGIVFDTYFLNSQKWAKVLELKDSLDGTESLLEPNIAYKVIADSDLLKSLKVDRFVGVVNEGSRIGKIKFEFSKQQNDLEEGDLLELRVDDKTLYYQVVEAITDVDILEAKNESSFILGEAIQLGEWDNDNLNFTKFGWVPPINTPIFTADTSGIKLKSFIYPEYQIGVIPNTNLPSIINLHTAVSHHLGLVGVTGSGKSFITREIIKVIMKDVKVICVDFTGEYVNELANLNPVQMINKEKLPEVEEIIAKKENEAGQRRPDKEKLLQYKRDIQNKLTKYVKAFIDSENYLSLFELPELSNTTFILEFTQLFLEAVLNFAKQNPGHRICIVLEEAHTIIPETNFLGDLGDYGSSKAIVSKMSQIALQGRKYGVGLFVIAQRTANVSKSVLTQCNTIVCFQAFDETSFNFLGNYIGKDLVQALPNLKRYHAVVTGMAIKSNLPMIVDLTRND